MSIRNNAITPQFRWDDRTGQYVDARGRFVPRTEVRRVIDEYLEKKSQNVRGLAEQLRNREISIAQWQSAMEQNIARVHLANLAAAKGGWHNLTQSDYGRVGQLVREEYKYLRRFAEQIENKLPLDGHFMQRAEQYAQAGRHTYHVVESREMLARGYDEQRFIRHAGDSCEDCVALAALGWHATGSTPEPGERKCKRKCKCTKEYRKSISAKDSSDAQDGEAADQTRDPGRDPNPVERLKIEVTVARAKVLASGKSKEEALRIYGEAIRKQKFEVGLVMDRNGKVLHHEIGSQYQVKIPESKKHLLADGIFFHNHPRGLEYPPSDPRSLGNSFSESDFSLAFNNNVHQIVAVTPRRRFSATRGSAGWKPFKDNFTDDYHEANVKAFTYEERKIAEGTLSPERAETDHRHRIWLYTCPKRVIIYEVEDQ